MTTNRDSAVGREKQRVGAAFEAWLEAQHQVALQLGIVAHPVEHNQAQTRVVGGRLIYTAPGVADYTGVLTRGAVTLAVEAKSTKEDHLLRSAVSPKQQAYLSAVAVAGGVALLCVEFRGTRGAVVGTTAVVIYRRFAVPWTLVPWAVKRSVESVSMDAIAQWEIRPGTCYLERFHGRGPVVGAVPQRVYPRE